MNTASERSANRQLEHAIDLHRSGHREQAVKVYRKVLKDKPDHPDALHFLGVAEHQSGDQEAAVRLIRRAIAARPAYADAIKNLGNVLLESKQYSEAEKSYRKVIELAPADATVYSNLCVALRYQRKFGEAIQAGQTAVQMAPSQLTGWYSLGNAYRVDRKFKHAIKCFRRALEIDPDFVPARDALCRSTFALERSSPLGRLRLRRTIEAYQAWLEYDPGNPVAAFMLSAVQGENLPRAPDPVIKGLFDRFADTFESHLDKLEYRVPQCIQALLTERLPAPDGEMRVLDGGCGTGLCAPFLREYARRLVGVDLSPRMLEKAQRTKLYDELIEAELTNWLEGSEQRFDLAVFADTLCYFGDLQPVITAASRIIKPGGLLVFTVEESQGKAASSNYLLHPHGRYSHAEAYVTGLIREAGFESIDFRREVIRMETGQPVAGLLVSAHN